MENRIILAIPAEIQRLTTLENPVFKWAQIEDIDKTRLEDTVEAAFEAPFVDTYFSDMSRQNAVVCYEECYKAVGVVIPDLYHIVTLARHPFYRGQNLGEKVLMEILARLGKFNLRSKPEREGANMLYRTIADGSLPIISVDGTNYNMYWKNHSQSEVDEALHSHKNQPSHFKK